MTTLPPNDPYADPDDDISAWPTISPGEQRGASWQAATLTGLSASGPLGCGGPRGASDSFSAAVAGEPALRPGPPGRGRPALSRALAVAVAAGAVGTVLVAWGGYRLLAAIDIFGWILHGQTLLATTAVLMIGLGSALLLAAVISSIIAIARSAKRWPSVVALVALLIIPPPAASTGIQMGGQALRTATIARAGQYAGQVDPASVEEVFTHMEGMGITVPGREEILSALEGGQ